MLKNVKIIDLKNAIASKLDIPEGTSFLTAKHLIEELDEGFEEPLKSWIEEGTLINVKLNGIDAFDLMHYMDMNYIEAIETLNLSLSDKTLESIKTCKKLRRKDRLWKTLACIFGC